MSRRDICPGSVIAAGNGWPSGLIPALGPMIAPFGGDPSMVQCRPWEPVQQGAARTWMHTRYGGWVYVVAGESSGRAGDRGGS